MLVRLADADRERLGCPEELDCATNHFTVLEAEAMEEATGLEPAEALELMAPAREDLGDGNVRLRLKPKGVRLMVWLGLFRAGISVPFDELTFDYNRFVGSFVQAVSQGKAESASSASNTRSRSRTTGRGTPSKKSPTSR